MLKHAVIAAVVLAGASANGQVLSATHAGAPVKPVKPYCDTIASQSSEQQDAVERTHATCSRKLPEVPPGTPVIPA